MTQRFFIPGAGKSVIVNGLPSRNFEIGSAVPGAEQATAGITYEISENRIGGGFYVCRATAKQRP
jgi:hypothetical protein